MTNRKKNIEFGIVLSLVLVIVSAYCQINHTGYNSFGDNLAGPGNIYPIYLVLVPIGRSVWLSCYTLHSFPFVFWGNNTDRNTSTPDEKRPLPSETIRQGFR